MVSDESGYGPSVLSTEASRAKRALISSALAVWTGVVLVGLTPTEIDILGITLSESRVSVGVLVSAVAIYFWVGFLIVSLPCWAPWIGGCRRAVRHDEIDTHVRKRGGPESLSQEEAKRSAGTNFAAFSRRVALGRITRVDYWLRTAWDLLLPCVAGLGLVAWLTIAYFR